MGEILLLERQPDVRDRLSEALAREGVYLNVTSRDEGALRAVLPLLPDALCLVGGGGTQQFLRWMKDALPLARAVVLWSGQPGLGPAECRALGATWLEARRTSPGQLAGMLRGVNHRLPRSGAGEVLCRLSPREHEVLAHVASGADNLTIAACLDITERTVRAHVSALYLKVGGESRAQLALRGRELGL